MCQLSRLLLSSVLALLCLCILGCGARSYPVKGRVTFEGQPLAGGGIAFIPTEERGTAAGGDIDAEGAFELSTTTPGSGALPGSYRVVITQVTEKEPVNSGDDGKVRTSVETVPPNRRIPAVYADHRASPLTATVEARPVNEFNFDLKRK